jgi:cyclohexyl-isocyanide hydratase
MLKIGILIYPNVAEMDFVGPFEVLSDVNKVQENSTEVYLIAQTKNVIKFSMYCRIRMTIHGNYLVDML